MKCTLCEKEVGDEVCGDGVCRDCHRTFSFEYCCDDGFRNALRKKEAKK